MCLLDSVLEWDDAQIRCATTSHHKWDNPLRCNGRLGILCGIEYAAQAMAVHGALAGDDVDGNGRARVRYLASMRAVACHADRLDLLPGPLFVGAKRLLEQANGAIYSFELRHDDRMLLSGRITIALS